MSKRKLTYKDFLNYFRNHLQNKDKHNFEKEMMRDAFEEEAFEGLSKLNANQLEEDLNELKAGISNRSSKSRRIIPVWFRYAASVIILIGIASSIIFLNSRFWQDSMLKEQVSQEMQAADSMVVEAEKQVKRFEKDKDSISLKNEELIAESKEKKPSKGEKQQPAKEIIVEENIVFDEVEISETDYEAELDDQIEIIEFEEEEEYVEEEFFMVETPAVVEEKDQDVLKVEEVGKGEGDKVKSQKKSENIRIRGVASPSKSKEPLYVIDGTPVKLNSSITIKGKILSSDDKEAIPGVSVVVEDMEIFGTVTNENGEFNLTIPDDDKLKILIASFVGMKDQEISLEGDTSLLVYMDSEALAMDEVVVTSYSDKEKGNQTVERTSAYPPGSISKSKYKKKIIEDLELSAFSGFPGKHKIKVAFIVNEDGSLSDFSFRNVPDEIFSNEILKVIKELGEWIPATENEVKVSSKIRLTLKIEIEERRE